MYTSMEPAHACNQTVAESGQEDQTGDSHLTWNAIEGDFNIVHSKEIIEHVETFLPERPVCPMSVYVQFGLSKSLVLIVHIQTVNEFRLSHCRVCCCFKV